METIKKYAPIIAAFLMFAAVFFLTRKKKATDPDRAQILEKAREAKLAKSILKNQENEKSAESSELPE
jgi:hypothetical protein